MTANPIDLRSDTVTQPTPAMRQAMASAALGDDVYGEDPTINRLQNEVADMAGFEAGLFTPSGSMGNQIALATHAGRGAEVIAPYGAHIYEYEIGAMCVLSGLIPRLVSAPGGVPALEDVRDAIKRNIHQAPTGLIALENTHNKSGGTVVPLERCIDIGELAKAEGLPYHLDGARAWNAAAALGVSIAEVCAPFDSASLCLSKGLAAPVGTVLVGSRAFIDGAHRYRKMFGGGMRQAGVLAAAGLVAVNEMVERLTEDHARARALAQGLNAIEGLAINLDSVQTNMIYIKVANAPELAAELAEAGLLCNALGARSLRLVTHYHISDEDVSRAVSILETAMHKRLALNA